MGGMWRQQFPGKKHVSSSHTASLKCVYMCLCEDVFFSAWGPNISMIGAHDSFDLVLTFSCLLFSERQIFVGKSKLLVTEVKVCYSVIYFY